MTDFLNVLALGVDVEFGGDLKAGNDGDALLLGGRRCLVQDLFHALQTPRGSYEPHPEYGTDLYQWLHAEVTDATLRGFQADVEDTVEDDPRVQDARAEARFDAASETIVASVEVVPLSGADPFNLVIGFGISALTLELIRG